MTPPAAVAAVAAWDGGGVPGPEWAEGRSRCDSSAEGARGALGAEGVRVPELPLRVSAASGARVFLCASGRCLRLSGARRRCSPSCRCHQPAEAGPMEGAGPQLPRPSIGGKVERRGLRVASLPGSENCQK